MVRFDSVLAFKVFKDLAVPRLAGSPADSKAAARLARTLRGFGLRPAIERFHMVVPGPGTAGLEVLSPYGRKYTAIPVGLSGNTPKGGLAGELHFGETGAAAYLRGIRGKIVLIYGPLGRQLYKTLKSGGARAVIFASAPGRFPYGRYLPVHLRKEFGGLRCVCISYDDALEMVKSGAKRVRISLSQKESRGFSQNIVATIPGTSDKDEWIMVGGHYDSLSTDCPGAIDNAGGAATAVALAGALAGSKPRRTIMLALFGAEELGLLGSLDFIRRHRKDMGKVKLFVNLDAGGATIGHNLFSVTGPKELRDYVWSMGRERGMGFHEWPGHYPSDNQAISLKDVPAVSIARDTAVDHFVHTPMDRAELVDAAHLGVIGGFASEFVGRMADAVELPFEPRIPKDELRELREKAFKAHPHWRKIAGL
jgi:aminopeptidase YwaD